MVAFNLRKGSNSTAIKFGSWDSEPLLNKDPNNLKMVKTIDNKSWLLPCIQVIIVGSSAGKFVDRHVIFDPKEQHIWMPEADWDKVTPILTQLIYADQGLVCSKSENRCYFNKPCSQVSNDTMHGFNLQFDSVNIQINFKDILMNKMYDPKVSMDGKCHLGFFYTKSGLVKTW